MKWSRYATIHMKFVLWSLQNLNSLEHWVLAWHSIGQHHDLITLCHHFPMKRTQCNPLFLLFDWLFSLQEMASMQFLPANNNVQRMFLSVALDDHHRSFRHGSFMPFRYGCTRPCTPCPRAYSAVYGESPLWSISLAKLMNSFWNRIWICNWQ